MTPICAISLAATLTASATVSPPDWTTQTNEPEWIPTLFEQVLSDDVLCPPADPAPKIYSPWMIEFDPVQLDVVLTDAELQERVAQEIRRQLEQELKRKLQETGIKITPPVREWRPEDAAQMKEWLERAQREMFERQLDGAARRFAGDARSMPVSGPHMPDHSTWTMFWDDAVDGQVQTRDKSCEVALRMTNGAIAGEMVSIMGETREAAFSGDVIRISGGVVITMRQDEAGYACVYSGRADATGRIRGTWHDTRGASGDFVMWHDGNRPTQGITGPTQVIHLNGNVLR